MPSGVYPRKPRKDTRIKFECPNSEDPKCKKIVYSPNKHCSSYCRAQIQNKTEDFRKKISATSKGRPKPPRSEEHKSNLSRALTGRKQSEEHNKKNSEGHKTHGLTHHQYYRIWYDMMDRCYWRPTRRYGLRGITVYEPWHDVRIFIKYLEEVLGPRPEDKYPSGRHIYELDRINNDGNYEPDNLRWSTHTENVQNRSGNGRTGLKLIYKKKSSI